MAPQGPQSSFPARRKLVIAGLSLLSFLIAISIYLRFQPQDVNAVLAGPSPTRGASRAADHVPGHLLLKVRPAYRAQCQPGRIAIPDLELAFSAIGFREIHRAFPQAEYRQGRNALGQQYIDLSTTYELVGDSSIDIPRFAEWISQHPALAYAEPRWLSDILYVPDDAFHPYQWYADSVYVHEAWDLSLGDTNIVIGFIDTGTSFQHEDLGGDRVAYNAADPIDGLDNDQDGYTDNYQGWDFAGTNWTLGADNNPNFIGSGPGMDHGVLVTGVACARPDNAKGLAGLGYNTRYLPLKAAYDHSTAISHGYDAIVYAADHGADILNLSWGSLGYSQFAQDAVDYAAINKGCLLVAAAGNRYKTELIYPASYAHVLSVTAISPGDLVWNNMTGTGATHNYLVDLSAYGAGIMTTAGPEGYWGGATGTSMSVPITCATAALVRAHYPNLNNAQAGEVVRVSSENIYPQNPTLTDKIGFGKVRADWALSMQGLVSIRVDSLLLEDHENRIAETWDTLEVHPRFINYLSPVSSASVQLSSPDTAFIEVLNGNGGIGAMGTLTTGGLNAPFSIRVKQQISQEKEVYLKFSFASGTYTDYQYVKIVLKPRRIDLIANSLQTTLNGFGGFAYTDLPVNQNGLGLSAGGIKPLLRDGGLLIGQPSTGKLLSATANDTLCQDIDLQCQARPTVLAPGNYAAFEVEMNLDDDHAGVNRIGVEVRQRAYQQNTPQGDRYIILEYTLHNPDALPKLGLYAGIQMLWDGGWASVDQGKYYPGSKAVAARFTQSGVQVHAGMALLTGETARASTQSFGQCDFTRASKLAAMTSTPNPNQSLAGLVVQTLGAGAFDLQAGESRSVAFALVYGADSVEMRLNAAEARRYYHCQIRGLAPQVDWPADTSFCAGSSLDLLLPGGNNYIWSNGATTASVHVENAGTYRVTASNSYGCSTVDSIEVLETDLDALYDLSVQGSLVAGSMLQFAVPDPGGLLMSWQWDFGDGESSSQPMPQHSYGSSGQYSASVAISDGNCTATLNLPIDITGTTTSIASGEILGLQVSPNPTDGPVHVRWKGNADAECLLQVLDANGKTLQSLTKRADALADLELDLSAWAAGVYFIQVKSGGQIWTKKVLKR